MISQQVIETINDFVVSHPGATTSEIQRATGCSTSAVRRGLVVLLHDGRVKRCADVGRSFSYVAGDGTKPNLQPGFKHQDSIIKFFTKNPGATATEMASALMITRQHGQRIAQEFTRNGLITRADREDRNYGYFVASAEQQDADALHEKKAAKKTRLASLRARAESLESRGLYRRAATQWIEVMDLAFTVKEREEIILRRATCLARCAYQAPAGYFS